MNDKNAGLPSGWAWTELGALSERRGGGTPSRSVKRYFQGSTPWLTVTDLPPIGAAPPTIVVSREAITDEAIAASAAKPIPKDSVVFATRVSIGKVAIAGCTLATNQDFRSLLPGPAHEPSYIAWFLSHIAQFNLPANQGTTIKGITTSKFDGIQVPLPPLTEQRRIVVKIKALQERNQRAREALTEVGPLLEQFRQSVLAAAFRGDLTTDWRAAHPNVEPASELLHRIRSERRHCWEQAELVKYEAKGKKPPENWKDSTSGRSRWMRRGCQSCQRDGIGQPQTTSARKLPMANTFSPDTKIPDSQC
jgi:type I restriction enzyme, S subunit